MYLLRQCLVWEKLYSISLFDMSIIYTKTEKAVEDLTGFPRFKAVLRCLICVPFEFLPFTIGYDASDMYKVGKLTTDVIFIWVIGVFVRLMACHIYTKIATTIFDYFVKSYILVTPKEKTCAICLVEYCSTAAQLHCGHEFHDTCIQAWIDKNTKSTCPMCRKRIY